MNDDKIKNSLTDEQLAKASGGVARSSCGTYIVNCLHCGQDWLHFGSPHDESSCQYCGSDNIYLTGV
ncbi:hypothetical protein LJC56_09590 [Christensenellaceae bacterium OttesenSCG-928-K19]|nr:hypothetical protein [Christensenellaceae bacterium OttesenSCG-928-K19]